MVRERTITLENLEENMERLKQFGLQVADRVRGLIILKHKVTGRKFIVGRIRCPYCGKEFPLYIKERYWPTGVSYEQFDSEFKNHIDHEHKEEFSREWIRCIKEPYQQGSWHKVKRYVCVKCGFKSRRYADTLIHVIKVHGLAKAKTS